MKRIKAIVLTFDKYRALTDHMIFKYRQLWPDHPFQFRVPFQDLAPSQAGDRVDYCRTPEAIKATVLALLEDLDDEELIYWCIDDKYPVKLDREKIAKSYQWLTSERASAVSGVLFCRCRRMWDDRCLNGEIIIDDWGNEYLERTGYEQIWIHQFVKTKVIRHLFNAFPDVIPFPRHMDELRDNVGKPAQHRLFVSRRNQAVFGESTERGVLTRNCYRSMLDNGLTVPSWASTITERESLLGTWRLNARQRLRYFAGNLTGRPPDFFY